MYTVVCCNKNSSSVSGSHVIALLFWGRGKNGCFPKENRFAYAGRKQLGVLKAR